MATYGQYCPIAQALDLLGDRWTLLIVRDMLTGTRHFNDLERGLPGISRALLAKRLRQLQDCGLVEKRENPGERKSTEYHLSQSGQELQEVINALLIWGTRWSFGDPSPEQLDPLLLLWWMHNRVRSDYLPEERIVIQFDFRRNKLETYWLMLTQEEVNICLTHPGYDVNLRVSGDLAEFFKLWLGRVDYQEAIESDVLHVDGLPRYIRAFPDWFAWSPAAPAVRAAKAVQQAQAD